MSVIQDTTKSRKRQEPRATARADYTAARAAQAAAALVWSGAGSSQSTSDYPLPIIENPIIATDYSLSNNRDANIECEKPHVECDISGLHGASPRNNTETSILIDCELGRLCKLRLETREFVLWAYAHTFADGEGRITRDELLTRCNQLGITTNRRTFNAWIQSGMGIYWRERGGYLYLTSWRKLSARLTRNAAKYHPDWVATNLPGQQRVCLNLTGSLQSVHANLYGGWLTVKAAKHGYLDISRYTLRILWGATVPTLRGYEKRLGVRVEERYAECADIHNKIIPAHAYLCLDTQGHTFASWQISNRYFPPDISIHPAKGQRHKVRAACNRAFDTLNPADIRRGGGCRLRRIGRITFYGKYGKKGYIPATKQLDHHLRKHGDILDRPHYVYLTTRYGKRIYECSTGYTWRRADDGRDRAGEQSTDFQRRRMGYGLYWAVRMGIGDKRL